MINLKTAHEIDLMARAGSLLASVLPPLKEACEPGVKTIELDKIADRLIREGGATPRRPRPGPPRRQPALDAPARSSAPPRRRRADRLLAGLLGLLALAVAVVAVVLITAPAPTKVVLRNVVYTDVQQTSDALKQLVSENTK